MAKTTTGKITDLAQDGRNANRHKARGKELLQKSLHELGAGRSVLADANGVLIAGNNTVETAISEGITKTIVVETEGDAIIVHKRTDLDLNDPGESGRRARQMALIDNAAALEGVEWDIEVIEGIENEWGFEAQEWGVEPEPEFNPIDYSGKNQEIDTDGFEDKMKISLEYTMEEYHTVKAALQKIAATPEQAVWQLLGL